MVTPYGPVWHNFAWVAYVWPCFTPCDHIWLCLALFAPVRPHLPLFGPIQHPLLTQFCLTLFDKCLALCGPAWSSLAKFDPIWYHLTSFNLVKPRLCTELMLALNFVIIFSSSQPSALICACFISTYPRINKSYKFSLHLWLWIMFTKIIYSSKNKILHKINIFSKK